MNILFLLRGTGIGGLEVVTSVLANRFVSLGHNVSVFIFRKEEGASILKRFDKRVSICLRNNYGVKKANIVALREMLISHHVQIVINQWGLPVIPIKVARKAAKGLDVKFISVYHNSPDKNGHLQGIDTELAYTAGIYKHFYLKFKRWAVHAITSWGMRYNYRHSDLYMVLSPSFVDKFKDFTGIRNPKHLVVQTNPVTINVKDYCYDPAQKQKEILFVGRLDFIQKRVSRVLDTWHLLEKNYLDWKLTIVGDGDERTQLEQQAKNLKLERVSFEGFQSSEAYYRRASILVLTSEFEGFGLVVTEGMSFGVVPVVYGSYSAIYDIIDQGKDGIIVPKVNGTFSAEEMAMGIEKLLTNEEKTHRMAQVAIEKSKQYSLDYIANQWMGWLERLKK